jgi:hypothetical protein
LDREEAFDRWIFGAGKPYAETAKLKDAAALLQQTCGHVVGFCEKSKSWNIAASR